MNYYQSRYEEKVLQYVEWACASHNECSLSELNDRFKVGNPLEVCINLVKRGKLRTKGVFELSFTLPSFSQEKCEHRIDVKSSRAYKNQSNQRNALRIETLSMSDRCSQKYPDIYNKIENPEKIANIIIADIVNGFVLDYGYCDNNCNWCK